MLVNWEPRFWYKFRWFQVPKFMALQLQVAGQDSLGLTGTSWTPAPEFFPEASPKPVTNIFSFRIFQYFDWSFSKPKIWCSSRSFGSDKTREIPGFTKSFFTPSFSSRNFMRDQRLDLQKPPVWPRTSCLGGFLGRTLELGLNSKSGFEHL